MRRQRCAFIYGVPLGTGGLGTQAGNALRALALTGLEIHAIGPGRAVEWDPPGGITWHLSPRSWTPWFRFTPLRRRSGLVQHISDVRVGRFAGRLLHAIRPDVCYSFTQVGLEALRWARARDIPAVLESPNGHIRAFRQVYVDESRRWCGDPYVGHPSTSMVRRVEEEYELATRIRLSSRWAQSSIAASGVEQSKTAVLQQPVDLVRFAPAAAREAASGALRVCFVGSLDLRKGFVYLLRAARAMKDIAIELVGGTGDRCCRQLLARERAGVNVRIASGDPRPAYSRADIFVLPTLEDGSPFAVAEAMASGLAVITTTATGAAEWVQAGRTGWLAEPASEQSLVDSLSLASRHRRVLVDMGREARGDTERRVRGCDEALASWVAAL